MDDPLRTRRAALTTFALVGAGVVAGCASPPAPAADTRQAHNEQLVRDAFARQVGGPDSFYAILADDCQWTVAGARPRTYTSRAQFLAQGSPPIVDRLTTPIAVTIRELYSKADDVVAWWDGTATAKDGQPYLNSYVWIMTLRDDKVSRVIAFLDTAAINELIARVPNP